MRIEIIAKNQSKAAFSLLLTAPSAGRLFIITITPISVLQRRRSKRIVEMPIAKKNMRIFFIFISQIHQNDMTQSIRCANAIHKLTHFSRFATASRICIRRSEKRQFWNVFHSIVLPRNWIGQEVKAEERGECWAHKWQLSEEQCAVGSFFSNGDVDDNARRRLYDIFRREIWKTKQNSV